MTDPQTDTFQYRYLLNQLNKALPLELTIRAAKLAYPQKLDELRRIDEAISISWVKRGFTKAEVAHHGLAELCWDATQLGWSERRALFECRTPEVHKMISDGIRPICEEHLSQFKEENYPFAKRYRCADLVRGMNVRRVLREFAEKYSNLKIYAAGNSIPKENFIYSVRSPVPVVPGAVQNVRFEGHQQSNYLGIMLRFDMSLEDVRAALLDFQYHYAKFRIDEHELRDDTTNRLLDPWGQPSMPSKDDLITQAHQVHPRLAGLYLYDCFIENGGEETRGARARAIKDTIALHPESVAPEMSRTGKWLDSTRKEIMALAEGL